MILKCLSAVCTHPEQDRIYGHGMCVHNPAKPKANPPVYRCTVCLYERAYGAAPTQATEKPKKKGKKKERKAQR